MHEQSDRILARATSGAFERSIEFTLSDPKALAAGLTGPAIECWLAAAGHQPLDYGAMTGRAKGHGVAYAGAPDRGEGRGNASMGFEPSAADAAALGEAFTAGLTEVGATAQAMKLEFPDGPGSSVGPELPGGVAAISQPAIMKSIGMIAPIQVDPLSTATDAPSAPGAETPGSEIQSQGVTHIAEVPFRLEDQSLWSDGQGLDFSRTYELVSWDIADLNFSGSPSASVLGAELGLDYDVAMTGSRISVPLTIKVSSGVFDLDYDVIAATAVPSTIVAGEEFQVATGLVSLNTDLSVTPPTLGVTLDLLVESLITGHLGLESDLPGLDPDSWAVLGTTTDGGASYTPEIAAIAHRVGVFSLEDVGKNVPIFPPGVVGLLDAGVQLNNLEFVYAGDYLALALNPLSLGEFEQTSTYVVDAAGLHDITTIVMPANPWVSLTLDVDDAFGSLVSLLPAPGALAVGEFLQKLDYEYAKLDPDDQSFDSKFDIGAVSINLSLEFRPVIRATLDAQTLDVRVSTSEGDSDVGALGSTFTFLAPGSAEPLSISTEYFLGGQLSVDIGMAISVNLELKMIGFDGTFYGLSIPALFPDGSDTDVLADSYLYSESKDWPFSPWFPDILSFDQSFYFALGSGSSLDLAYGDTVDAPQLDMPGGPVYVGLSVLGAESDGLQGFRAVEGNSGDATAVTFRITRSGNLAEAVDVGYQFIGGMELDADDFVDGFPANGTVSFAVGETVKDIVVTIRGDELSEVDEVLTLALQSTANVTVQQATVELYSDDLLKLRGSGFIVGTSRDEWIEGSDLDDLIKAGSGNDLVRTRAGSDTVEGESGNDVIHVVVDGTDVVSAGLGTDRLSIDGSAFAGYQGEGFLAWDGSDLAGQALQGVTSASNSATIRNFAENASTFQLYGYSTSSFGVKLATLDFTGVEHLDLTASAVTNSPDLMFVIGQGSYDGKGGDDAIYADLSAMTTAVTFDADSDQTYSYLGSNFTDFERFLITAGSGNDYIDSSSFNHDDWLVLGTGGHVVLSGGGSDYVSMVGAGDNYVIAGDGNDTVLSGGGDDVLELGSGHDSVVAGEGGDEITITFDENDQVSAGGGVDRLVVDASAFAGYQGEGFLAWDGGDLAGQALQGVTSASNSATIRNFAENASTFQLYGYSTSSFGVKLATLDFTGVEHLDLTASAVTNSPDLMFVIGQGSYDGKGGDDAIYADLSAMTTAVTFDADSDQTYSYLGSNFTDFERFLITAGSGNDYIDSSSFNHDDWLVLGTGGHVVLSGGGSDYVSMVGAGDNYVIAGDGNDTVLSGGGDDVLELGSGHDSVVAGEGGDEITITFDENDQVSAGGGVDRLVVDASAFAGYQGEGFLAWDGSDLAGQALQGVTSASNSATIRNFAENASTFQLYGYSTSSFGVKLATLDFTGVEHLDLTASAVTNSPDLMFVIGQGSYDGKGGDDAIYADLSAMTAAVTFDAESDQTYSYLGSNFTDFERFLITAGSGNDYIDSSSFNHDDWLVLGTGNDVASTGGGRDYLRGGGGNDLLDGGIGADSMYGEAGNDLYVVDDAGDLVSEEGGSGIDAVLASIGYTLGAEVENLTLTGGAVVNGTGNTLNNLLIGNDAANVLDGRTGKDTLIGGGGNDVLNGGDGDDRMEGGAGDDVFVVLGKDLVVELAGGGIDEVRVTFDTTIVAQVENLRQLGSANINAAGNGLANTFFVNAGNNAVNGSGGVDTVSYMQAGSAVTASLAIVGAQATGGSGSDSFVAIENLTGSNFNDTLTGSTGNNLLDGGNGNDSLLGGDGIDTLVGGAGADTMTGGAGNDIYVVQGADTLVELAGGGIDEVQVSGNYTLGAEVETLRLTGDANINGAGNTLDNLVYASTGNNGLNGAAGIDTLSYAQAASAVTVSLGLAGAQATGGSGSDTVSNFENLIGSLFNDTLSGSTGDNRLEGSDGNDSLNGDAGNDTLLGGLGNDTLRGGAGDDVYVLQAADTLIEDVGGGIDEVQTKGGVGLAANIENLRLTGTGNTNGSGNSLDNLIYANVGNNSLNGGGGVDTASYALSSSGVTVSLGVVGAQVTGGSGTDTLTNFENLGGTGYDDVLGGNGGNNVLDGAGGNDSLTGGAGNDTLIGGGGNDTMAGGTGDDVYALQGADVIVENASEGIDEVQTSGNAGLAANIENLRLLGTGNLSGNGNGGDNVLTGNTGNNGLNGAGGNDTLVGGAGNDTLIGGSGNDTIVLNSLVGSDTITDFVSGVDKLRVDQSGIAVGDGDTVIEGAVTIAGPGSFAASSELVVVTGNIAGALTAASAAAAIGSATSAYALGQETLFMVDNGTDSALYLFSSLDTDALVEAGELTLLTTLVGTGTTTTGDLIFGG